MGQHPVPPVNIPIPTKIGSKLGGEFTNQPKWDPTTVLTTTAICATDRQNTLKWVVHLPKMVPLVLTTAICPHSAANFHRAGHRQRPLPHLLRSQALHRQGLQRLCRGALGDSRAKRGNPSVAGFFGWSCCRSPGQNKFVTFCW